MTAPSTTLIRIPTGLHAQLKDLAHIRRTTMTGLIHSLVREAEAAGEIATDIPNFKITLSLETGSPRYILGDGDTPLADMTPDQVLEFCDRLNAVLTGGSRSFMALEAWQVMIARVGTGIAIERQELISSDERPNIRRTLTPALVADLAIKLRHAVLTN